MDSAAPNVSTTGTSFGGIVKSSKEGLFRPPGRFANHLKLLSPAFVAIGYFFSPIFGLDVDLHSNLRLWSIWVRHGTEIETGALFSLNLSASFAALSGESGLLFDCGLPGFDDGV